MPTTTRKAGATLLLGLLTPVLLVPGASAETRDAQARYADMVARVAAMPSDTAAVRLAQRERLEVLNLLWEDTGRYLGSSVGPNISDVTIEVETSGGQAVNTALMPVLRAPNFSDRTGDVAIDRVWLPVGNQKKHGQLTHVTLRDFLAQPGRYLSLPQGQGSIRGGSLLADRDSHALVSAQATFLPVPATGSARFYPVVFNYQSTPRHPAVLTLLVTRQGTSVTVIDNGRDTISGRGQRLYFNAGGERAPFTAERLSAVQEKGEAANGESAASLGSDANLLMLIQVPLKTPPRRRMSMEFLGGVGAPPPTAAAAPMKMKKDMAGGPEVSDVEVAVLGHGPTQGPFNELDGMTIERDPRFPVRVTVQFYQATSNGVVSANDVKTLAAQIEKVYARADYVGSLVVPNPADKRRPTNWDGVGPLPPGTRCEDFPALYARGACRPGPIARRAGID
jgi:hypothetical protein